jgi:hypothetical protein
MNTFYDAIGILGFFVQLLGLVLFGIATGWFTLYMSNQPERTWQLQAIVYGVLFAFIALMVRFLTPGALGVFLTGTAGAMIFWGLIKNRQGSDKKK